MSGPEELAEASIKYPKLSKRLETMTGAAVHLAKHVDAIRAELEVPEGYDEEDVVLEVRRLRADLARSAAVVEAAGALARLWDGPCQSGWDREMNQLGDLLDALAASVRAYVDEEEKRDA